PSPGCGQTTTQVAHGLTLRTLPMGGATREFRLYVPDEHDGSEPLPMVMDFHGLLETAELHARSDQWEVKGEEVGAIVVTPQGLGPVPHWNAVPGPDNDDIVFVRALYDLLGSELCVDLNRVYAGGLSNGGMMSSALACAMADTFAAIGLVSGILFGDDCQLTRPVPGIVFWGKKDPILPYEGGLMKRTGAPPSPDQGGFPPVEVAVAKLASLNGCSTESVVEPVSEHVEKRSYPCPEGVEVALYVVSDGGHTWPGSELFRKMGEGDTGDRGVTTDEIDATSLMWEFFARHPMR
ncbi:MAG: hypothetical protein N2037_07175, partial [Acidimicrobiales bacterium]|nr:hypothetical protein [Acidimicrobiales bacterium]